MATVEVTKDNFTEIIEKNEIVFFDFWADWCAPCKTFSPIFEKVSEQYPNIVFGKINTEVEQELAQAFEIKSIPTMMIFRESILLLNQAGVVPEEAFPNIIQQVKDLNMDDIRAEIAKVEAENEKK